MTSARARAAAVLLISALLAVPPARAEGWFPSADAGALAAAERSASCDGLACLKEAYAAGASPGTEAGGTALSADERGAVARYVDSFAYLINKALRLGDRPYLSRHAGFIETMARALDRSPSFHGVVYRGSDYPPPAARLAAGEGYVDPAFVSTSRSLEIAEHYAGAGGFVYAFLSRSGRVVAYDRATKDLSVEAEVIFKAGTRFTILAVAPEPEKNRTVIFVEEAR